MAYLLSSNKASLLLLCLWALLVALAASDSSTGQLGACSADSIHEECKTEGKLDSHGHSHSSESHSHSHDSIDGLGHHSHDTDSRLKKSKSGKENAHAHSHSSLEASHGHSHSHSQGESCGHSHAADSYTKPSSLDSDTHSSTGDTLGHSQEGPSHSHSHEAASHGHSHGELSNGQHKQEDSHAHSHGGGSHGHAHGPASHGHSHAQGSHGHSHGRSRGQPEVNRDAVWGMALIASFVVSCASLICLAIIPVISAARGKALNTRPPERLIQILTGFAVGAMLGDAFTHQLPHAFANAPPHSHDHSLLSSIKEQSTGLSVLFGILAFFLVEKMILYIGGDSHSHSHSHGGVKAAPQVKEAAPACAHDDGKAPTTKTNTGWLNLVADAVHNYTDGLAIGAAFLSGGTFSGWSRTMFILAHELPQEVGDFGVLLSAGFNPLQALFFNFLSALVAMAGTLTALCIGTSSGLGGGLIEGFTAGGFIYISVASVIPQMHENKHEGTLQQISSISAGMIVCVLIHASGGCSH